MVEIGYGNLLNSRISSEKFFVWPQYNAGRVNDIHGVTRRTESNITYTKPFPEDRDRLLALVNENSLREYSPAGKYCRSSLGIHPGSFFDAIA